MNDAMLSHLAQSDIDLRQLPPQIRLLSDCMGLPATLRLLQAKGGTQYNVPMCGDNSPILIAIVGLVAARALSAEYGGQTLSVPKLDKVLTQLRNRMIVTAAETSSLTELARQHQLTTRQISNILAACRNDDASPQGKLF